MTRNVIVQGALLVRLQMGVQTSTCLTLFATKFTLETSLLAVAEEDVRAYVVGARRRVRAVRTRVRPHVTVNVLGEQLGRDERLGAASALEWMRGHWFGGGR